MLAVEKPDDMRDDQDQREALIPSLAVIAVGHDPPANHFRQIRLQRIER